MFTKGGQVTKTEFCKTCGRRRCLFPSEISDEWLCSHCGNNPDAEPKLPEFKVGSKVSFFSKNRGLAKFLEEKIIELLQEKGAMTRRALQREIGKILGRKIAYKTLSLVLKKLKDEDKIYRCITPEHANLLSPLIALR